MKSYLRWLSAALVFATNCFDESWAAEPVTVTATIDTGHPDPAVPKSFAGFSREWRRFPSPDGGPPGAMHPVYLRLIEHLAAFNDEGLRNHEINEIDERRKRPQITQIARMPIATFVSFE